MTLPYDVSRCTGDDCPINNQCSRFLDPGRGDNQAYIVPPPYDHEDADCAYFIGRIMEIKTLPEKDSK